MSEYVDSTRQRLGLFSDGPSNGGSESISGPNPETPSSGSATFSRIRSEIARSFGLQRNSSANNSQHAEWSKKATPLQQQLKRKSVGSLFQVFVGRRRFPEYLKRKSFQWQFGAKIQTWQQSFRRRLSRYLEKVVLVWLNHEKSQDDFGSVVPREKDDNINFFQGYRVCRTWNY